MFFQNIHIMKKPTNPVVISSSTKTLCGLKAVTLPVISVVPTPFTVAISIIPELPTPKRG